MVEVQSCHFLFMDRPSTPSRECFLPVLQQNLYVTFLPIPTLLHSLHYSTYCFFYIFPLLDLLPLTFNKKNRKIFECPHNFQTPTLETTLFHNILFFSFSTSGKLLLFQLCFVPHAPHGLPTQHMSFPSDQFISKLSILPPSLPSTSASPSHIPFSAAQEQEFSF